MAAKPAHHLSGLLSGLAVLPLKPPRPVAAAVCVGFVVVLACTVLFDPAGRDRLVGKLELYLRGAAMMVVGRDKKWKKKGRPDPALVATAKDVRRKRVLFVRHGESEWNLIFNVGPKIFVPLKAAAALVRETLLFLRLDDDSVLYDSPLNEEGLKQARDLDAVFAAYDGPAPDDVALALDAEKSVVCSSNLRRAAQTVALGLQSRLGRSREKVHCLSALQEISTNVDTLSITPAREGPRKLGNGVPAALRDGDRWDSSANSGNKRLRGRGLERLQAFSEWTFKRDEPCVIAGGHSLFFRAFFREFLPAGSNPLTARDNKVANGGVVAFTLERGTVEGAGDEPAQIQYRVVPESLVEVHLGFDTKEKRAATKASAKAKKAA